ncbi:MAG: hypothetical protein QXH32_05615 [Candidatus Caldarchaeum sp.]
MQVITVTLRGLESLVLTFLVVSLLLASPALTSGQQILRLEDQNYNQKNRFLRGEQVFVVVVAPSSINANVLVHYPPNSPGPSPKTFVAGASIPANVESRLGPIELEQNAPCGKYQIEVVFLPPRQSQYIYFDYATNEPPCTSPLPPPPPPPDLSLIAISIAAVVVIVAAVALLFTRRRAAAPPKAPAVPVRPPVVPPTTTAAPPKQTPRMSPQVRRVEEDRGD